MSWFFIKAIEAIDGGWTFLILLDRKINMSVTTWYPAPTRSINKQLTTKCQIDGGKLIKNWYKD
jgi:hypothetical protein